ncbi:MAG TPA: beta-ketoacyl-ACP synthase II [Anaerolineales bacterium]|nr:beta-ketoacyl-ACP synthase II [Anaerolineales bacterium]
MSAQSHSYEPIVITGLGTVNPLGLTAAQSWQAALEGASGVGPITLFDPQDYQVRIAGEVKGFIPENYVAAKESHRRDRFELFAAAAVQEALAQSGIQLTDTNRERAAVIISSAVGGIQSFSNALDTLRIDGPRRISPFTIPMLMINGASGMTAIDLGIQGPSYSLASACASGADGIGLGWTLLRAGAVDIAFAGASEAPVTPLGIAAFDRVGAISRRLGGDDPAPRPFDRDRDGLVLAEGAAVLVMERLSHARQRGAVILAELAGYAATSDAYHITAPAEDGSGGARAIRDALRSAGISPDEVSYINAHGTGTVLNDLSETRAIKTALGSNAYKIPVSSTKSMTGHMMGATGALEALFCVKAIQESCIPPTINYHTPDPECDLDIVPNQARQMPVEVAVSNAFGFGGHNAVLVLRKFK